MARCTLVLEQPAVLAVEVVVVQVQAVLVIPQTCRLLVVTAHLRLRIKVLLAVTAVAHQAAVRVVAVALAGLEEMVELQQMELAVLAVLGNRQLSLAMLFITLAVVAVAQKLVMEEVVLLVEVMVEKRQYQGQMP
jgi:hypothetical protein